MYRRYSGEGRKTSSRCSPEKMLHLIPVVVLLCFFILWCFSYPGMIDIRFIISRIQDKSKPDSIVSFFFYFLYVLEIYLFLVKN